MTKVGRGKDGTDTGGRGRRAGLTLPGGGAERDHHGQEGAQGGVDKGGRERRAGLIWAGGNAEKG